MKGTLDMRLYIGGQHIDIKDYSNMDRTGDVEKIIGLPPYTFSLLERWPYREIANNNKRWHNLQCMRNIWSIMGCQLWL